MYRWICIHIYIYIHVYTYIYIYICKHADCLSHIVVVKGDSIESGLASKRTRLVGFGAYRGTSLIKNTPP